MPNSPVPVLWWEKALFALIPVGILCVIIFGTIRDTNSRVDKLEQRITTLEQKESK